MQPPVRVAADCNKCAGLHGATTTGRFIARQIVERHGSHIGLESHKQESSTFFSELP